MTATKQRRSVHADPVYRRLCQAKRLPVGTRIQMHSLEGGRWHGTLENEHARIEAEEIRPSRLLAELARKYARELYLRRPIIRPPLAAKIKKRKSP